MKQALPHVTGGSLHAVNWRIYVLTPQEPACVVHALLASSQVGEQVQPARLRPLVRRDGRTQSNRSSGREATSPPSGIPMPTVRRDRAAMHGDGRRIRQDLGEGDKMDRLGG